MCGLIHINQDFFFSRMFSLCRLAILLIALLAIFPLFTYAGVSAQTATWLPSTETGYSLDVSYAQCLSTTGNVTFTAGVTGLFFGNAVTDANVFATIRRPDLTTFDVNFTNDLSGVYTQTSNLTQNGTYFFQAHAYKPSVAQGDFNGYIYVHDLNWTTVFLNNGFDINIGELGTIRNRVTNVDGNIVYDINANTTIYYPTGTVADANSIMTQIPNGEFIKPFFGPSPSGVYTVSTYFSCGPLSDYNSAGTFTSHDTNTSGSTGGTGSTGSGGSSGGSGSGGGGGASGGSAGKKAQIISIDFDPILGKNAPSKMTAMVQNLSSGVTDYTIFYTLTTPSGLVATGEKNVLDVGPYNITTVTLDPAFTPLEMGTYSMVAELFKINSIAKYDTYVHDYLVQGAHSLTFDTIPASDKTAVGLSYPFTINLLNNGDFIEENIRVEWYILDSKGNEYIRSSYNTTLNPSGTASLPFSPFIPIDAPLGLHQLIIEVRAYNVTQTQTIVFTVASPSDYYAQLIQDIELRLDQLSGKLDSLQQRGFDVGGTKITLLEIQTDLARAKGMLLAGQFETLNKEIIDLSGRVTRLAALIDALEQQSPLLSREGLNLLLYIGAGLLLALFAWLLYWSLEREKKERGKRKGIILVPASPTWLTALLGVEKCYILASERPKLKRKPLIDRLIGLIEGESSHGKH